MAKSGETEEKKNAAKAKEKETTKKKVETKTLKENKKDAEKLSKKAEANSKKKKISKEEMEEAPEKVKKDKKEDKIKITKTKKSSTKSIAQRESTEEKNDEGIENKKQKDNQKQKNSVLFTSESAPKTSLDKEETKLAETGKLSQTDLAKENIIKTETTEKIEHKTIIANELKELKMTDSKSESLKKSNSDLIEQGSVVQLSSEKNNSKKTTNAIKNEFQTLEVVVLVILTCVVSLAIGGLLGLKFSGTDIINNKIEVADKEIQEFIQDYNYLIDNYYGDIDKKALLNAAFKSMVDTLGDAYSGNIDEATSNNFDIELKGSYEGLGIEIINDSDMNILIYSIISNSPASQADIKAGDKIISVNGQEITNMATTDFINNIVKPNDSQTFKIELEREGNRHTIEINKEKIVLESVTSKRYVENNIRIGYIKVEIFAENTYEQFQKQLKDLEKEGMDSLIIDLRDNNGGHLTAVSDMISLFLDSSHVIYQTESKSQKEKVYSTGKTTKNYPIVILGNGSSASASEVMIGALTEEYGAILIGNKTFGKGTVQELHSLSNGDEYKFTTKKWLTPKGVWVHNQGIAPKVEVTLAKEYYTNPIEENDNQLRAAINYLTGQR